MTHTIGMISLGCAKNQVNAEQMLYLLRQAGYEILPDPDGAELVIINTCGFIDSAKEEAIDHILAMGALKQEGRVGKILVTGCLAQRYQEEIVNEMPEVDGVLGTGSYYDIVHAAKEILDGKKYERFDDISAPLNEPGRILTTPEQYAYLKIAEGCDNYCAFCIIPKLRGHYRSRKMEELIAEAKTLAEDGVKELIVIAQDTTYYGLDLYGKRRLAELLRRLCRIDGIGWIRLHYAYPTAFPDEVIEAMASEPKICKYLDIPFQHISDAQLSAMHRRHTKAEAYALVEKLRGAIPDLALRTTLLVGYPGETEADFTELEQFVRDVRFERLGVFAYSEEEGTYSARELADNVPEVVKQQRVERIMTLQNDIARENNLRRVGRTERVLIDSRQGDYYVGRTQYDSPEVDQEILIPAAERRLLRGHFYEIRIDGAADYDLYGKAVRK